MENAITFLLEQIVESDTSSSDSSEDDFLTLINNSENQRRERRPRIVNYIENVVPLYSEYEFKSHFRMRRTSFQHILCLIGPKLKRNSERYGRQTITPEKQLFLTIWMMATPDSYRSICTKFNVGNATAWRVVRRVVKALYSIRKQVIRWPTREEAHNTARVLERWYKFPNVIGAIDGTHIKIAAPKHCPEAYINRKGFHSIQLQVVCNESLQFIHVYTGQVGSVHDMRVLKLSGLQKKCSVEHFYGDNHILGDAAYGIEKHIMVPYKDNGHLTNAEVNFNTILSTTRMIVERSIGLLKGRFRSLLDHLPMKKTEFIPEYIVACCILHNICLTQNDIIDVPIIVESNVNELQAQEACATTTEEGIHKRLHLTEVLNNVQ